MQLYDPATDLALTANYSAKDLKPKRQNKRALQRRLGLPVKNVPVLAVVSRLTKQKGIDLLLDALNPFLQQQDVQLIVLGTGTQHWNARYAPISRRIRKGGRRDSI